MAMLDPNSDFPAVLRLHLDEYEYVIERSRLIKCKLKNYEPYHPLLDRILVTVFEKNLTRTRLSFKTGMR